MNMVRGSRVTREEAYAIITDDFSMSLKEMAEKYNRKPETIKRIIDSPKYAAYKERCDEALQARYLEVLLENAEEHDE